ncbi:MAG: hypothetical protein ACRCZP_11800 [Phycicoccus sp.]
MSSSARGKPGKALVGVQVPRREHVPPGDARDAADAIWLARSYGLVPDPWQEHVLRGWLGRRPDGLWAAGTCGLAVPRQNGKNGVIEVRQLFGMVVLGERWLHTAHEVKTQRKAFRRLLGFFENPDFAELAGLVKEIRRTNGQEAIFLHNEGSIEFVARSKSSGRGFTGDALVLDEAQELNDDALAALLSTMTTSENLQIIMTGTPPGPAADGEVFTRTRKSGLAGDDPDLCWMEWSAEPPDDGIVADADGVVVEPEPLDMHDPAVWARGNPSLGLTSRSNGAKLENLARFRRRMDDDTFGREVLGLWEHAASADLVDPLAWAALGDATSQVLDPVAVAVDVSPLGKTTSIALAGARSDGRWHVEVIRTARGTDWVIAALATLQDRFAPACVVVDKGGPAGVLLQRLRKAGHRNLVEVGAQQVAQACGGFLDAVHSGDLRHIDQPALTMAVTAVRARPVGDAIAFARKHSDVDITPACAAAFALWGWRQRESRPRRTAGPARVLVMN